MSYTAKQLFWNQRQNVRKTQTNGVLVLVFSWDLLTEGGKYGTTAADAREAQTAQ